VLWHLVVDGQGTLAEEASDERGHQNREHNNGQRAVATHMSGIVADNFLMGNDFWDIGKA